MERNHESISDIVTEMRKRDEEVYVGQSGYPESWKDQMDYDEIYELADRIEFAHKREHEATIEKYSINGNNASIREALEELVGVIDECNSGNPLWWHIGAKGVKPLKDARAALSSPLRNCDCHLAKNLIGAVTLYCSKNPDMPPMVEWNAIQYLEFCKWLFSESKEE